MNLCPCIGYRPLWGGASSLLLPCSGPGTQSSVPVETKGKGLCLVHLAREASSEVYIRVLKCHRSTECPFGVAWPQQEYCALEAIDSLWVFCFIPA